MPYEPVKIQEYAPEFKEDYLPENYPRNTIRSYGYSVTEFTQYCQEKDLSFYFKPDTVHDDTEKIRDFYQHTSLTNPKTNAVRRLLEYIGKRLDSRRQQAIDEVGELVKYSKVTDRKDRRKINKEDIKEYLLTEEQIEKALDEATVRQQVIITTLLETGMRAGELAALTKNDIDFSPDENGLGAAIQVTKTYVTGMGVQNIPKSEDSLRAVEMRSEPADLLKDYIRMEVSGESVFPSYSTIRREVQKPFIEAGIETFRDGSKVKTRVTPHWMRHIFITWQTRKGVDVDDLMRVTGHGGRSVLKEYQHLSEYDVVGIYSD